MITFSKKNMAFYGIFVFVQTFFMFLQGMPVLQCIRNCLFLWCLWTAAVTDIRERRIPNYIICTGILIWYAFILLLPGTFWCLLPGTLVSMMLLVTTLLMSRLLRCRMMGAGDIKLIFCASLYMDKEKVLIMLFLSCIFGVLTGMAVKKKKGEIAFAPSIAMATALVLTLRI